VIEQVENADLESAVFGLYEVGFGDVAEARIVADVKTQAGGRIDVAESESDAHVDRLVAVADVRCAVVTRFCVNQKSELRTGLHAESVVEHILHHNRHVYIIKFDCCAAEFGTLHGIHNFRLKSELRCQVYTFYGIWGYTEVRVKLLCKEGMLSVAVLTLKKPKSTHCRRAARYSSGENTGISLALKSLAFRVIKTVHPARNAPTYCNASSKSANPAAKP
jgi:hypothetical protein